MKRITIDPITRLEGHGKIEIFLNNEGEVNNVYFQVPELRGFEKFIEIEKIQDPFLGRIACCLRGFLPLFDVRLGKVFEDLFSYLVYLSFVKPQKRTGYLVGRDHPFIHKFLDSLAFDA